MLCLLLRLRWLGQMRRGLLLQELVVKVLLVHLLLLQKLLVELLLLQLLQLEELGALPGRPLHHDAGRGGYCGGGRVCCVQQGRRHGGLQQRRGRGPH